jgi:hypothetical protein
VLELGNVGIDRLAREDWSRLVLERGIADHGGAAAEQGDRPVAGLLQPVEHHDLDQVTDMEARRGRVEPDIGRDRAREELFVQPLGIGDLIDEAAFLEDAQEVRLELGHRSDGFPLP